MTLRQNTAWQNELRTRLPRCEPDTAVLYGFYSAAPAAVRLHRGPPLPG